MVRRMDVGQPAARVGPAGLCPRPDAVVGAAQIDDVAGRVPIADGADVDLDSVAVGRDPTATEAIVPELTVQADAEELVIAAGQVAGEPAAGIDPAELAPGPDAVVGAAQEDHVVGRRAVPGAGHDDLCAPTTGRRPRAGAVAVPNLAVEADGEDLVVAGRHAGQPAVGVEPGAAVPDPDPAVGVAQEDDVVGGIAVAGVGDGDLDAPAAAGGPGGVAIAPELTVL